jgi:hypothetical protein
MYKVIHSNSAVNNKWSAFETLLEMLKISKKNNIKYKLMSPINIVYI